MNREIRRHGPLALLLSCEHASDHVPAAYRSLFQTPKAKSALASHRGIDFGAKRLGRFLAREFKLPLIEGTMTRLVIDLNRSAQHPQLFSEFSKRLPQLAKDALLVEHQAYHAQVAQSVKELSRKHSVLHIAVHSFTPQLGDIQRTTDIGILFDPRRSQERDLAHALQWHLRGSSSLKVHRNAPYRGIADGLPTSLRKTFGTDVYSGIELEVNQRLLKASSHQLSKLIAQSIEQTLTGYAKKRR